MLKKLRRRFIAAAMAAKNASSGAPCQFGRQYRRSSSIQGNSSLCARRRAKVDLPEPLVPTTLIFISVSPWASIAHNVTGHILRRDRSLVYLLLKRNVNNSYMKIFKRPYMTLVLTKAQIIFIISNIIFLKMSIM